MLPWGAAMDLGPIWGLVGKPSMGAFEWTPFYGSISKMGTLWGGVTKKNQFYTQLSIKEQRDFFSTHIGPWAKHFFRDLESAEYSVFYAPVGRLGSAFMEVEMEAFRFL